MKNMTLEQERAIGNLNQTYAAWMEAEQAIVLGRLRWKTVNETDYLYRLRPGRDTGTSLGPRSPATELQFEQARSHEEQSKNGAKRLLVLGRIYKATRAPMIATFAGEALRALDRRGILGDGLQVVGTNALPAYELEAARQLPDDLHATEDFDLSWIGKAMVPPPHLLDVLREADATWTVSMERTFQLVNRNLEIIDVVVAPSRQMAYPKSSPWKAVDLDGQEDLLGGVPVSQVVADFSGRPARIVAPDPRLFALHKFLLSQEPERKAIKRAKDRAQAEQVMALVEVGMPHYPMDEAFIATLSDRLGKAWAAWAPLRSATADSPYPERRPRVR